MSDKIILYGSPICGMVSPVRRVLDQAAASYEYIDISQDPQAKQRVRDINQGPESVPTLEFPDGSTLTEPSMHELQVKLRCLGYQAGTPDWTTQAQQIVAHPVVRLLGIGLLLAGVVAGSSWAMAIGAVIFLAGLLGSWLRGRR